MSMHTPGPWLFGLSNRNNEAAIIGDIDSVVCYLPDASTGCTFKPADARLIAAAPDLLAALEAFIALDTNFQRPIATVQSVADDPACKSRPLALVVAKARAAIAKATAA